MARRYLMLGVAAALGYVVAPRLGLPAWVAEIVFSIGLGASASVAIVVGTRRWRPRPALAWHLFAAGTLSFVLADLVFVLTQDLSSAAASFPSVADALYL